MLWTTILIMAFLGLSLFFYIIKRARLRETQAMFKRFNENKDVSEIVTWIEEKHGAVRFTDVLDYLFKIEDYELAAEVYLSFEADAYPARHVRVMACKALQFVGNEKEALFLADRLIQTYPNDDSILDIYIGALLRFDKLDEVRQVLIPRLERKMEGTIFERHHANLLDKEGKPDKAFEIMDKIVDRDYMRYKNTLAPSLKSMLFEQYAESQFMLDELGKKLGREVATRET